MTRRSIVTGLTGALAGAVAAVLATALSAGILIDGAAGFVVVNPTDAAGRALIEAGEGALYTYVLGAGAVGGGIISYLTAILSRMARPDEPRFGLSAVSLLGALIGSMTAYGVLRAGVGLGGSIENDVVTLSAFRGLLVFLSSGLVGGWIVAASAEWLSRPAVVGLQGEAWPESRRAFLRETTPAMLIPTLAILAIIAVVFGVSRILLAGNNVLAVTVATAIAALVLGGGAFLASSPPPTSSEEGGDEAT